MTTEPIWKAFEKQFGHNWAGGDTTAVSRHPASQHLLARALHPSTGGTATLTEPKIVEIEPDILESWCNATDRYEVQWQGSVTPRGWDGTAVDEHRCAAGENCCFERPAPVGYSLDGEGAGGWELAFMVDAKWVVCEDCARAIEERELLVIGDTFKWADQ